MEWTKIKSENDLPKKPEKEVLVIDKENGKEYPYHYTGTIRMKNYWLKHFSHWKVERNDKVDAQHR